MVVGEIDPRARHECSEAGDKVFRTEQDVCGAVAERVLVSTPVENRLVLFLERRSKFAPP